MDRDLLHSLLRLRETKSESCEILVTYPSFNYLFYLLSIPSLLST